MIEELWKIITDYPNYEVSDLGRVRSISRDILMSNKRVRHNKGRILISVINSRGYDVVTLHNNSGQSVKRVHRLVAEHFNIGRSTKDNQVNHIDGNKRNNKSSNLEWCDQNHNNQHGYRMKLIVQVKNEDHPNTILTNKDVIKIRQLLKEGNLLQREIAEIYGVKRETITRINTRYTFKDL